MWVKVNVLVLCADGYHSGFWESLVIQTEFRCSHLSDTALGLWRRIWNVFIPIRKWRCHRGLVLIFNPPVVLVVVVLLVVRTKMLVWSKWCKNKKSTVTISIRVQTLVFLLSHNNNNNDVKISNMTRSVLVPNLICTDYLVTWRFTDPVLSLLSCSQIHPAASTRSDLFDIYYVTWLITSVLPDHKRWINSWSCQAKIKPSNFEANIN